MPSAAPGAGAARTSAAWPAKCSSSSKQRRRAGPTARRRLWAATGPPRRSSSCRRRWWIPAVGGLGCLAGAVTRGTVHSALGRACHEVPPQAPHPTRAPTCCFLVSLLLPPLPTPLGADPTKVYLTQPVDSSQHRDDAPKFPAPLV